MGDAMLAMSFAIDDEVTGDWVAHDWTTGVAYKWDEPTGAVVTTTDLDGNVSLTPLNLAALGTEDPLPPMYLSSTPVVYQALGDLGLEGLANLVLTWRSGPRGTRRRSRSGRGSGARTP